MTVTVPRMSRKHAGGVVRGAYQAPELIAGWPYGQPIAVYGLASTLVFGLTGQDPPTGPEWLPGFAPGNTLAHDPWTSTGALPAGPTPPPPGESEGLTERVRGGFQEWRYQTPRRQMVFTILGVVCLIAAIVATVVVLTL